MGRLRHGSRPFRRTAALARPAMLALAVAATACSPIGDYRSLAGVDVNDPDPKTAPYSENMQQAEAQPYPNLASVPPPPTIETSTADRQKLLQGLIADRAATAALAPAPPPPATPAAAGSPTPAATPPAPATGAPSKIATASSTPATAPTPSAPTAVPGVTPGGPPSSGAAPPTSTTKTAAKTGQPGASQPARKAGEPPEPGSLNTAMEMPQIESVPTPEAPRPPPPAVHLTSVPVPPTTTPPAAAMASATPTPPPPMPQLPPIAPPPSAKPPPRPVPTTTTVATLDIAAASGAAASNDHTQVERVASLYNKTPGTVRVVAYAAAPAPGADPLSAYRAALDRAQAVAKSLAAAGIPTAKIQTEATPASGPQIGRVEIQLAP